MELMGCGTALVTPFRRDGGVDEPALHSLVNWQIESGIDFLVPCGTTGEASTLTEAEWLRVTQMVVATAAGRVPGFGRLYPKRDARRRCRGTEGVPNSWLGRDPNRQPLLQQARTGGTVSALP